MPIMISDEHLMLTDEELETRIKESTERLRILNNASLLKSCDTDTIITDKPLKNLLYTRLNTILDIVKNTVIPAAARLTIAQAEAVQAMALASTPTGEAVLSPQGGCNILDGE
jgi:hypothetical protein